MRAFIATASIILSLCAWAIWHEYQRSELCEAKGGSYIESSCYSNLKEIHIP